MRLNWPAGWDAERFRREVWQQRPMLLPGLLADFTAPISADEVAGLALEDEAHARLIHGQQSQNNWRVAYGPFEESELTSLPEQDWTLLVTDVQEWLPAAADFLNLFRLLPDWRLDDLMISIAAPGGSVGAHVDQYDVFLAQAEGRRRWQFGGRSSGELIADSPLRVLTDFEPEHDVELGPGDVLYLPPGVPHHGVALSAGMTWSVGFRAPSQREWLPQLAEILSRQDGPDPRYRDQGRWYADDPARFDADMARALRELLVEQMPAGRAFQLAAAQALTEGGGDATAMMSLEEWQAELQAIDVWRRAADVRALYIPAQADEPACLVAAGQVLRCSESFARWATASTPGVAGKAVRFETNDFLRWLDDNDHREVILSLAAMGFWEPADE